MKTICFDFDGVIANYDGWKGLDVFGKPNWEAVEAMQILKAAGYHIIIWTTRKATPALKAYLARNKIPYDSINSNAHNPPDTSAKPIYHVLIDDRAIQEAAAYDGRKQERMRGSTKYADKELVPGNSPHTFAARGHVRWSKNEEGERVRNKRSVWTVNNRPFKEAHFATYPEDLIEPMIKAGCPQGGVVLDPFMGAGTTAVVAKKLGQNYIGIELNPKYIEIAEKRLLDRFGMFK